MPMILTKINGMLCWEEFHEKLPAGGPILELKKAVDAICKKIESQEWFDANYEVDEYGIEILKVNVATDEEIKKHNEEQDFLERQRELQERARYAVLKKKYG